ncbi:MAG: glycerol-3-phosphate 1-O-acyltransferase PlsY [Clostridia bacterium]|nr:glycerol-3-phosphate 1-O-acyltransferase PlsY [Clostridia bacterium]
MTVTILCVISGVIAYLLGSMNTSMLVSKFMGKDVRKEGSGNAGATNTLRVFGKGAAAVVVLGDALKGVIAVLIARILVGIFAAVGEIVSPAYTAAFCVVLGHNFPLYFGFKGGKGIMTSAAVIFMLDWRIGLIVLVCAIAVMAITRYVSLGSCIACIIFPVAVILFHSDDALFIVLSLAMAVLALFMHRANIVRLIKGTESKINFKK